MKHLGGYANGGDLNTWSPEIWDYLIEKYNPMSCLDVGCGEGQSLEYFMKNKIGLRGLGVEGMQKAINDSPISENIKKHDFIEGEFITDDTFDMCWCCEFVEHVEEKYMDNFLNLFMKCKVVAMTHAVPGQPGHHHVNCKSSEYWIKNMSDRGFDYIEESVDIRNLTKAKHVRNTLLIFVNKKL